MKVASSVYILYTEMAMDSVRTKPFAPTKVGILSKGLSFKYSAFPVEGVVSTSSRSSSFALAITRGAIVRGLCYCKNWKLVL